MIPPTLNNRPARRLNDRESARMNQSVTVRRCRVAQRHAEDEHADLKHRGGRAMANEAPLGEQGPSPVKRRSQ